MAEIVLKRPTGYKSDRLRAYQIYVDGRKIGQIKAGETKTIDVTPGRHELRLKIDWGASETLQVDLRDDDVARLVCGPRLKTSDSTLMDGYKSAYWMTFGSRRYIDLQHGDHLPVESVSGGRRQRLGGLALFGILLFLGIALWALTGNSVVAVGVVVGAMALVVGALIGRGFGKGAVKGTEEIQDRRAPDQTGPAD